MIQYPFYPKYRHQGKPIIYGVHSDTDVGFDDAIEGAIWEITDAYTSAGEIEKRAIVSSLPEHSQARFIEHIQEPKKGHLLPAFVNPRKVYYAPRQDVNARNAQEIEYMKMLQVLKDGGYFAPILDNLMSKLLGKR